MRVRKKGLLVLLMAVSGAAITATAWLISSPLVAIYGFATIVVYGVSYAVVVRRGEA